MGKKKYIRIILNGEKLRSVGTWNDYYIKDLQEAIDKCNYGNAYKFIGQMIGYDRLKYASNVKLVWFDRHMAYNYRSVYRMDDFYIDHDVEKITHHWYLFDRMNCVFSRNDKEYPLIGISEMPHREMMIDMGFNYYIGYRSVGY